MFNHTMRSHTLRTLLLAPFLVACATTPVDDRAVSEPASDGKSDGASKGDSETGLVELLLEHERAMFAIRCEDAGEFAFKIRGAVLHGGLYPGGWIDATSADPDVLTAEGHTSTTHTMGFSIPEGVFLAVAPMATTSLPADHPYPVNSDLVIVRDGEGLVAAGRFAGRDGQWTCNVLARDTQGWTTLL